MKEVAYNNDLVKRGSMFWSPEYLEMSAWLEHIPFAFWLIDVVRPKILVELGVHTGTSYFSFCQAVKRLNINCACYGVDTWRGDEQAGFYSEEIFNKVNQYNAAQYAGFSTLIRSTFDKAKDYFINETIDVLHIDGFHTYDAVKHDFETWLPKLSPDAIVIFHDINVREREFGVFKLWEELKSRYQYLQFDFGHGLGIITIGDIHQPELAVLFNSNYNADYYHFFRSHFSERGQNIKNSLQSDLQLANLQHANEELKNAHIQLNENYKTLESHYHLLIDTRKTLTAEIEKTGSVFNELKIQYDELNGISNNRSEELEQLKSRLYDIERRYNELTTINGTLLVDNKHLKEKTNELQISNNSMQEQNVGLESKLTERREEYQQITSMNEALQKQQQQTNHLLEQILSSRSEIDTLKNSLSELSKVVNDQNESIQWYKNTYVNRGLLGVVSEKIGQLFKKDFKGENK